MRSSTIRNLRSNIIRRNVGRGLYEPTTISEPAVEEEEGEMTAPLQGIRVLALGSGMPSAITTMLMADYGADVITVDAPSSGDPVPFLDTRTWDTVSYTHLTLPTKA